MFCLLSVFTGPVHQDGRGFLYILEFFVILLTRYTCMGIMQIYRMGYGKRRCMKKKVDSFMEKLEHLMEIGGTKKDIVLLVMYWRIFRCG